jgi:hypothetical protein
MSHATPASSKLVNRRDERVGRIAGVVGEESDDGTSWAVVRLGWLGLHRALVPIGDAVEQDGAVGVIFETEHIRAAPSVSVENGRLSVEQADVLRRHYGLEPVLEPSGLPAEGDVELPRETRDAKPPALQEGPESPLTKRRRKRARELGIPQHK